MNRQDKGKIVSDVKNFFESNGVSFIVGVGGLNVESLESIRRQIHLKSGKLKIAKNTLLRLALKDISAIGHLDRYFKGQIAIVFTPTEKSPEIAKILSNFAKTNDRLKLIAGSVDNKLIDARQIEIFANLPTRDQLLAKLAGLLKFLIARQVIVLNQTTSKLVWALDSLAKQGKS
jgi:large subunit ribosomal protein L10